MRANPQGQVDVCGRLIGDRCKTCAKSPRLRAGADQSLKEQWDQQQHLAATHNKLCIHRRMKYAFYGNAVPASGAQVQKGQTLFSMAFVKEACACDDDEKICGALRLRREESGPCLHTDL